jgi:hypothetical protein
MTINDLLKAEKPLTATEKPPSGKPLTPEQIDWIRLLARGFVLDVLEKEQPHDEADSDAIILEHA